MLVSRCRRGLAPASTALPRSAAWSAGASLSLSSASVATRSELGACAPELREKHHVQHPAQVVHARGAAGAALQADDPLHRGRMAEAPLAERVFEIDQLLGELVELPVLPGVPVDLHPGLAHRFVELP